MNSGNIQDQKLSSVARVIVLSVVTGLVLISSGLVDVLFF